MTSCCRRLSQKRKSSALPIATRGEAISYFYEDYTKLIALRKATETALGAKFNQMKFHDFILAQGLLPPDLTRKAVIEHFIPSLQTASASVHQ